MSDFLGRLLGTAPTPAVRPLLPSRFEPQSRDPDAEPGIGAPVAPATPTRPPASAGPDDDAFSRGRAALAPTRPAPDAAASLAAASDALDISHPVAPAVPSASAERAPAAAPQPVQAAPVAMAPDGSMDRPRRRTPPPREHPVEPLRPEAREPVSIVAARPDPPSAAASPRAPEEARSAAGGPRDAGPVTMPSGGPATVRPMLPEVPRPVAPPRPQARRDRAAAEPTVHITIGRVEVRATAPAGARSRRLPPEARGR